MQYEIVESPDRYVRILRAWQYRDDTRTCTYTESFLVTQVQTPDGHVYLVGSIDQSIMEAYIDLVGGRVEFERKYSPVKI